MTLWLGGSELEREKPSSPSPFSFPSSLLHPLPPSLPPKLTALNIKIEMKSTVNVENKGHIL